MSHPDVDSAIRTLPIREFALAMGMNEDDVRGATLRVVRNALATGGSIDNMRKTMEAAIEARRARGN